MIKYLRVESFNTQPPEGGWTELGGSYLAISVVSTHSRLKAAGQSSLKPAAIGQSFNTQPPEGGWICWSVWIFPVAKFQHTAA